MDENFISYPKADHTGERAEGASEHHKDPQKTQAQAAIAGQKRQGAGGEEGGEGGILLNHLPTLAFYIDTDLRVTYINDTCRQWYGGVTQTWVGKTITDIGGEALFQRYHPYLLQALAGEKVKFINTALERIDGKPADVEIMFIPDIRNGRVAGICAFITDVSEHLVYERALQASEEALRKSEERFRDLFTHAAVGMALLSLDGKYQVINDRGCEILGRSSQEVVGKSFLDITYAEDYPQSKQLIEQLIKGEISSSSLEKRYIRGDGSWVWVRVSIGLLRDSEGRPRRLFKVMEDIQERKKAEEALRKSERQFRRLTDTLPIFIWVCKTNGVCRYCSPGWEAYTGQPVQEALGRGWLDRVHPDDRHLAEAFWKMPQKLKGVDQMEFRFRRKDGQYRWFLNHSQPVYEADGSVSEWFGTSTDVHDSRVFREQLAEARDVAEAASRAKDQFLAVLSHELRTPLTPVLVALPALQSDKRIPEELQEELAMIQRNVELESRLIDDLLDLTRVSKGKLILHREAMNPHVLLDNVMQICAEAIHAKKLKLNLEFTPEEVYINADPARLQQIFWNLLKNAIKFTPEGGRIKIHTHTEKQAGSRPKLFCFEITDTGLGLSPEQLQTIFRPFIQVSHSITHRFGGLGLGLTISRALAELHSGELTADSPGLGKGATFKLILPTVSAPVRSPQVVREVSAGHVEKPPSLPKKIAMLVEDHEDTRKVMSRLLEKFGYMVVSAATVKEALEIAEEKPADFILSDVGLPDGSGHDLLPQLQKILGPVPAIALSGYGMEEDIKRSKEAGFSAHLTKPVNAQHLIWTLQQVLEENTNTNA